MAVGILAILMGGVITGYLASARRAEWSAHSLAAHSLAVQGIEQARAARWDPRVWPAIDELPPTNFSRVEILDVELSGRRQFATNFISVESISTNPPLRQLRADCVWSFALRGLFTNTVITQRAPDQ